MNLPNRLTILRVLLIPVCVLLTLLNLQQAAVRSSQRVSKGTGRWSFPRASTVHAGRHPDLLLLSQCSSARVAVLPPPGAAGPMPLPATVLCTSKCCCLLPG